MLFDYTILLISYTHNGDDTHKNAKLSDDLAELKFDNAVSKVEISNFQGHFQCLPGLSSPKLHKILLKRG